MSYIWKQRQYTRTKQNSKEEIYTNTLDGYGVHKLLNMSFGLKKSSAQSFAKQQCCSIAWVVKKNQLPQHNPLLSSNSAQWMHASQVTSIHHAWKLQLISTLLSSLLFLLKYTTIYIFKHLALQSQIKAYIWKVVYSTNK